MLLMVALRVLAVLLLRSLAAQAVGTLASAVRVVLVHLEVLLGMVVASQELSGPTQNTAVAEAEGVQPERAQQVETDTKAALVEAAAAVRARLQLAVRALRAGGLLFGALPLVRLAVQRVHRA